MLVLKDELRPRLKPGSSGGGKSSNQTSTLQTANLLSFLYLFSNCYKLYLETTIYF